MSRSRSDKHPMDSIQECPVLKPTQSQFSDFYSYMEKIERLYKNDYGMVKICPPKKWSPRDENYQNIKNQMEVKRPISQSATMAKAEFYEIKNMICESTNLPKYHKDAGKNAIKETDPREIQKMFWKTVKYSPPLYGADLNKSLMSHKAGDWNLAELNSVLREAVPVKVKGVTFPYIYVGSWKSMFCWHKEDLDLSAINYLHEGSTKNWYCIQKDDQDILEQEAIKAFPQNYKKCRHFMRHKTTLINPYTLKNLHPELKITKAYQEPNEFIVAFGGSYHCGFNSGNNIAEAVNFATREWFEQLQGVNFCQCSKWSVKPEYQYFIDNLEQSQSRFYNDPSLKQLKTWAVENGFYSDLLEAEPATEDNTVSYQRSDKVLEKKDMRDLKKCKKIAKRPSVKGKKEKETLKSHKKTQKNKIL